MAPWPNEATKSFPSWGEADLWRKYQECGWKVCYRINGERHNTVYKCTLHVDCKAQLRVHEDEASKCTFVYERGAHSSVYAVFEESGPLAPNLKNEAFESYQSKGTPATVTAAMLTPSM